MCCAHLEYLLADTWWGLIVFLTKHPIIIPVIAAGLTAAGAAVWKLCPSVWQWSIAFWMNRTQSDGTGRVTTCTLPKT